MKAKKAPIPKVQHSAQDDEDEETEEGGEGVPDFDEFLENLNSDSDNEDDIDGDGEEDEEEDGENNNEDEEGGSSDDELAAALEEEETSENGEDAPEGEDGDESSDMEFEEDEEEEATVKAPPKKKSKKPSPREEPNVELRPVDDDSDDEAAEPDEASHQAALRNLEQTDPEFFAYLKENDAQLLDFGDEDNDDDEDSSDDEDEDGSGKKEKGTKGLHKPPTDLEVASDSEAEEELLDEDADVVKSKVEKFLKKGIVNLIVIADWEKKLSTTKDLTVLTNVVEAFDCAVETVLKEEQGLKWKIKGSSHFNALVRLCIHHLKGFCVRFLLGSNNQVVAETQFDKNPFDVKEKCKSKWVKLRPKIKLYMASLMAFLKSMGNPEAIASVLKHCQKMSGFFAIMSTKSYKFLRVLISTWATGEESCRVLAFLSIIRMANYNKTIFLTRIFKQMYMSFVANCKFTSANSWPCINFMRSSLVEVYLLDTALSYSVAFPFIRQLAIHLRNAVTAGTNQHVNQSKKEASRIVYSWQFVHSVHLWCDLLAQALGNGDEKLKLLVYPIVQICLGTIKLIPTRKYVPLRFHIVKMLINLQDKSKIYIPILPLATEVLHLTDFSSKTIGKFSVRPLDLKCCLKADPTESGYFKAVSEAIFDTILGACKACATELAFPEIVTPTLINLKTFLKKRCKNVEVSKKFKTLVEKIEENSTYIKAKRSKAMDDGQVTLKDVQSQRILQAQMLVDTPGPPLLVFANEYFKTSERVAAKARKNNTDTREESRIPKPSSTTGGKEPKKAKKSATGPLFSKSDSEDDDDEDSEFKTKFDEQTTAKKSNKRKAEDDSEDDDDDDEDDEGDDDDYDDEDSESEEEVQPKSNKSKKKKIEKPIPTFTDADYPDDMADDVVDLELSD